MRPFGRAAVALAVAAAVLLPSPTASAAVIGAYCTDQGHNLTAYAYFSDVGPHHHWDYFEYQQGGHGTAGKSNVKFWLYEVSSSNVVYWNHSPDNLVNDVWYGVSPPWDVYTWAANVEFARFHAWFDERWLPDPDCSALTPTI
jgi:hypothetical protein